MYFYIYILPVVHPCVSDKKRHFYLFYYHQESWDEAKRSAIPTEKYLLSAYTNLINGRLGPFEERFVR